MKSGEHFTAIRTVDGDDVKAIVCNVEANSCKLPLANRNLRALRTNPRGKHHAIHLNRRRSRVPRIVDITSITRAPGRARLCAISIKSSSIIASDMKTTLPATSIPSIVVGAAAVAAAAVAAAAAAAAPPEIVVMVTCTVAAAVVVAVATAAAVENAAAPDLQAARSHHQTHR